MLIVIPDFLCNIGGFSVSYFMQVQNAYNFYWPLRVEINRLAAYHTLIKAVFGLDKFARPKPASFARASTGATARPLWSCSATMVHGQMSCKTGSSTAPLPS